MARHFAGKPKRCLHVLMVVPGPAEAVMGFFHIDRTELPVVSASFFSQFFFVFVFFFVFFFSFFLLSFSQMRSLFLPAAL